MFGGRRIFPLVVIEKKIKTTTRAMTIVYLLKKLLADPLLIDQSPLPDFKIAAMIFS